MFYFYFFSFSTSYKKFKIPATIPISEDVETQTMLEIVPHCILVTRCWTLIFTCVIQLKCIYDISLQDDYIILSLLHTTSPASVFHMNFMANKLYLTFNSIHAYILASWESMVHRSHLIIISNFIKKLYAINKYSALQYRLFISS